MKNDIAESLYTATITMLIVLLLVAQAAWCQDQAQKAVLEGVTGIEVISDTLVLVDASSVPVVRPAGIFSADLQEGERAVIRVTDQNRIPQAYQTLAANRYLIDKPGRWWVDALVFDAEDRFRDWQSFIVEVGEPGPPPPPPPPVPPDQFDDIGQRVAGWSNGMCCNPAAAEIYARYAQRIASTAQTIDEIAGQLKTELRALDTMYAPVWDSINADLRQRWTAGWTKQQLANYWSAIAKGFAGATRP